jgi:hypothetical protein
MYVTVLCIRCICDFLEIVCGKKAEGCIDLFMAQVMYMQTNMYVGSFRQFSGVCVLLHSETNEHEHMNIYVGTC